MARSTDPVARFWRNVDRMEPDGCWLWTGCTVRGYGQTWAGRKVYAHRFAWELENGPIPDGMQIDHMCHNGTTCHALENCPHRRCCNPRHLRTATPAENISASHNALMHRTHCARGGHPLEGPNLHINRRTGGRSCKACRQEAGRRHDEKRRPARRVVG